MTKGNFQLKVTQTPDAAKMQAVLKNLKREMVDFARFHKAAAVLLDRWVQKNFKGQGKTLGADAWPDFKIGGRRIKGGGIDSSAKLLQDTGRLRISHLPFSSAKDAGIGSDLPYSKAHHLGMGNLPARRTLPIASEVSKDILNELQRHYEANSRVNF